MITALFLLAQLAAAPSQALPAAPLPEVVLAEQRGGIRLPNGIDLALAVQTQTAVNGAVVLQTVFALDKGPATLSVYVPKDGEVVPSGANTGAPMAGNAAPTVSYNARTGISVTPGVSSGTLRFDARPGGSQQGVPDGLTAIDPAAAAQGSSGVTAKDSRLLRTVTLSAGDLSVAHFAGSAFGSAITNTGSDRSIDTLTTVSIDLRGATPEVIGSALFQVENLALGALGSRM